MSGLMTYRLLKECLTQYASVEYGDSNYVAYLRRIQTLKANIDDRLLDEIIEFLNKWQCRLPDAPPLRSALRNALSEIEPLVAATRQIKIEEADLSCHARVGEQEALQLDRLAHVCFDRLMAVGERFSSVATAKTLHMLSPSFFVMWDSTISAAYRARLGGEGCNGWFYAYKFLPRMKFELANLLEDGMRETGHSRDDLLAEIRKGFGLFSEEKTVAKVLDEFNYIMFTKGMFLELFGPEGTRKASQVHAEGSG